MNAASDRLFVRIATILVIVSAFVVPLFWPTPSSLPDVALGSKWLLYLERALGVFVVLLLALTVLVRGWKGQLPTNISHEGFEWAEEIASSTEQTVAGLQTQIDSLESDIQAVIDLFATHETEA